MFMCLFPFLHTLHDSKALHEAQLTLNTGIFGGGSLQIALEDLKTNAQDQTNLERFSGMCVGIHMCERLTV